MACVIFNNHPFPWGPGRKRGDVLWLRDSVRGQIRAAMC